MDFAKLRRFIDQQNQANRKERKKLLCIFTVLLLVELGLIVWLQFIPVSTASIVSAIIGIFAFFYTNRAALCTNRSFFKRGFHFCYTSNSQRARSGNR